MYFVNANILHVGDIIFGNMFPFVDINHGGSVVELANVLQTIINIFPEDVKIIPGHGYIYTMNDMNEYLDMVKSTTEIVEKEMEKGTSLEEMKSEKILVEWVEWDRGFSCDDWIGFIYNSLIK